MRAGSSRRAAFALRLKESGARIAQGGLTMPALPASGTSVILADLQYTSAPMRSHKLAFGNLAREPGTQRREVLRMMPPLADR